MFISQEKASSLMLLYFAACCYEDSFSSKLGQDTSNASSAKEC